MSYVRWSTKVREDCSVEGCKSGYIQDPEGWRGVRLCPGCTSCWYIYWSVGEYIAMEHSCSVEGAEKHERQLAFEDAAEWKPPKSCPMGDVALRCVAEALADWESREHVPKGEARQEALRFPQLDAPDDGALDDQT